MVAFRGRAASPIRPGFIVKKVLSSEIPLETGELVTEASISDLHSAYREVVRRENSLRPKNKQLRGMTAFSFKTFFKFAQLQGLVQLVREEPMKYPPPGGPLYSVRIEEGVPVAVLSTRRIFSLTSAGTVDERSWGDLRKSWQEKWQIPEKIAEVPEYVPPTAPPVRPRRVVKEFPTFRWVSKPSPRQFSLLLRFLEALESIGPEDERVIAELDSYAYKIGDWLIDIEDLLADARSVNNTRAIAKLESWEEHITALSESLADRDLEEAIRALSSLA